jgi:soluble lytic murein transglycosylase-like protein
MEANVLWLYEQADEQSVEDGMNWYPDARSWAFLKAQQYGVEVDVVAAIISALSPRNEWSRNLLDADRLLMCYERGDHGPDFVNSATFKKNVWRAWMVRAKLDSTIVMTSPKTRAFVDNITWPEGESVTIDTWAYRIAEGNLSLPAKGLSRKNYDRYAGVYQRAARFVGLRPCELQAVTWVEARKRVKILKRGSMLQMRLL